MSAKRIAAFMPRLRTPDPPGHDVPAELAFSPQWTYLRNILDTRSFILEYQEPVSEFWFCAMAVDDG